MPSEGLEQTDFGGGGGGSRNSIDLMAGRSVFNYFNMYYDCRCLPVSSLPAAAQAS